MEEVAAALLPVVCAPAPCPRCHPHQIDLQHTYYFAEVLRRTTAGAVCRRRTMACYSWGQPVEEKRFIASEQATAGPLRLSADWFRGRYLAFVRYNADRWNSCAHLRPAQSRPDSRGAVMWSAWSPLHALAWVHASTGHFTCSWARRRPGFWHAHRPERRAPCTYYTAHRSWISPPVPDGSSSLHQQSETIYVTGGLWRRSLTYGSKRFRAIEERPGRLPAWSPVAACHYSLLGQPWHHSDHDAPAAIPFRCLMAILFTGARWAPPVKHSFSFPIAAGRRNSGFRTSSAAGSGDWKSARCITSGPWGNCGC